VVHCDSQQSALSRDCRNHFMVATEVVIGKFAGWESVIAKDSMRVDGGQRVPKLRSPSLTCAGDQCNASTTLFAPPGAPQHIPLQLAKSGPTIRASRLALKL
jgi:hypothetical protein